MEDIKVISGSSEQDVWQNIEADLTAEDDVLNYDVVIKQSGKQVQLTVDIDPGGGFEGGFETTELRAPLSLVSDFRFAVHDEDFIDEIGKFFGMEDVETGYTDLDKNVVIKSNNEEKVHRIFEDADVRELFARLEDFDLVIHHQKLGESNAEQPVLELNINEGITDPASLRAVYHAFYKVLETIENA
ncbi:hypothetical protein [Mucilaginibacter lacusdianchii]|uniref:hypothetical protein n=1 Tax=Mucilaginibacter lacusdianchii TaxID=2684211 RepID=UPI00131C614A|nr:hypothetical protein [Mucilaginibacter sp. JXJ CY 39]